MLLSDVACSFTIVIYITIACHAVLCECVCMSDILYYTMLLSCQFLAHTDHEHTAKVIIYQKVASLKRIADWISEQLSPSQI